MKLIINILQQFLLLDEDRDLAPRMVHKSVILKDGLPHCDWSVEIDHMTARWEISLPEVVKRKRQRDSTSDTSRLLHEVRQLLVYHVILFCFCSLKLPCYYHMFFDLVDVHKIKCKINLSSSVQWILIKAVESSLCNL